MISKFWDSKFHRVCFLTYRVKKGFLTILKKVIRSLHLFKHQPFDFTLVFAFSAAFFVPVVLQDSLLFSKSLYTLFKCIFNLLPSSLNYISFLRSLSAAYFKSSLIRG